MGPRTKERQCRLIFGQRRKGIGLSALVRSATAKKTRSPWLAPSPLVASDLRCGFRARGSASARHRLLRRGGRGRLRRWSGDGTWPDAWSERQRWPQIAAWTTSETKESPWRPAEVIAVLRKVRNQFVGDIDFNDRLLGAGPELLHGLPGLIAQLAVDAPVKAIEAPQLSLRFPDLLGRIGPQYRNCLGHGRPAWLGGSSRDRNILREFRDNGIRRQHA